MANLATLPATITSKSTPSSEWCVSQ